MTNLELQNYLKNYEDELPIKILVDHTITSPIQDMDEENILFTSETAHVNGDAREDEWDTEDGKIELGNGQKYLLINPIIV